MTALKRIPLTPKAILLTISVALISWGMLEFMYNQKLKSIFETQLNSQLNLRAQEARVRFDNYVNAYATAIEIATSQTRFADYMKGKDLKASHRVKYYRTVPPWMPAPSVMRRLILVSYGILMDGNGVIKEVYQGTPEPLPGALLKPDALLRALSFNQSLMTKVGAIPFVLTAKPVNGPDGRIAAILMFASPLNDEFLTDSQGFAGSGNIVVLISEGRVLASNRPDVLASGTSLDTVQRNYLLLGKSFFDTGSSDLLIEFASLMSRGEYAALVNAVLTTGRQNRMIMVLAFIIVFSAIMSGLTRRIEALTRRVSDFSQKRFGGLHIESLRKGDQLDILEESFERLTEEVVSATGRLRKARDELELRVEERTAELRESEKKYRVLLSSLNEGIWAVDKDNNTTFINPKMTQMLGFASEEIMGKPIFTFMDERGRAAARRSETRRREGTAEQIEQEFIRKDGARLYTISEISPIFDERGNYTGAIEGIIDITERRKMEATITHQAHHDLLTGLANKALFTDHLNFGLTQAHRYQKQLAVLFLDLDRFKTINDTVGHTAGDKLLKQVAGRLKPYLRETDTIARMGGDEFTILVSQVAQLNDISKTTDKIMASLKQPFRIDAHTFYVTASIGISLYPDDGRDGDTLIKNADIAMYHAKELGGNNYQFYNPSLNIRTLERIILENSLRQTLDRGELELFYQPQFDILTGEVICVEALVRWRHPEQGLLDPVQFIPLAEEIGFIVPLDEWVLRTACAQNRAWQEAGYPRICVTVNLSSRQFRHPGLVDRVSRTLQDTGLDAEWLELEVVESVAMQDIEYSIPNVKRLTNLGIGFSIDDFGTGYSSLSYLKKLPLNKLKIDKSFIRDITTDHDDQIIVNAIISMAHSMKLKVVAEGVETQEQLSVLRSQGCDEVQGFIGSRPLAGDEFVHFIRSNGHLRMT